MRNAANPESLPVQYRLVILNRGTVYWTSEWKDHAPVEPGRTVLPFDLPPELPGICQYSLRIR